MGLEWYTSISGNNQNSSLDLMRKKEEKEVHHRTYGLVILFTVVRTDRKQSRRLKTIWFVSEYLKALMQSPSLDI
jgi:putative salt-induced outer membrane protein YdiY